MLNMETATRDEFNHARDEVGNEYKCQKLIKRWIDYPKFPSSQVIPMLHKQLMEGINTYQKNGLAPLSPGTYRNSDITIGGTPDNFCVSGQDVHPVMLQFATDLDATLRKEISSPIKKLEETIHDAAWAYSVYERIHPFLDGNGRTGRMILKRIVKSRGYKDIIFQTNATNGKGRTTHLDAMEAVANTGNLAHLEIYLLDQLRMRYMSEPTSLVSQQIEELIARKKQEVDDQKEKLI